MSELAVESLSWPEILCETLAQELGYRLAVDLSGEDGEILCTRQVNKVVTDIVGIYKMAPISMTGLNEPEILTAHADVFIAAKGEIFDTIRNHLDEWAIGHNATVKQYKVGGKNYIVSQSCQTSSVSNKRRDVGAYAGEVVPISMGIDYTIIQDGMNALEASLRIDGYTIPTLRMTLTRTMAAETFPDDKATGNTADTMQMFGVTFDAPITKTEMGDLLQRLVDEGGTNVPHAVEIVKAGKSHVYMMAASSGNITVEPPVNVGVSISMSEIMPAVANFSGIWEQEDFNGSYYYNPTQYTTGALVFWGDGTAERAIGWTGIRHAYLDGKPWHTIRAVRLTYKNRYEQIYKGTDLFGKRLKVKENIDSGTGAVTFIRTDTGDKIFSDGKRTYMQSKSGKYPIDTYIADGFKVPAGFEFVSTLTGKVEAVNVTAFELDRWW